MQTEAYIITYQGRKFYAQVQEIDDNTTEIVVGGRSKRCVSIHVYADESYVYLSELLYDSLCSMTEDLEKKSGTVSLLHASLLLCKYLYPNKREVRFTDESVIKCGGDNVLPLPEVYMLLYGKTWYETYFDVKLEHKNQQVKLNQVRQLLSSRPTLTWDVFWTKFLSVDYHKRDEEILKEKYTMSSTWHEFFEHIKNDRCKKWLNWVLAFCDYMFKGFRLRGTSWKMSFPEDEVIISPTKKLRSMYQKPSYTGMRLFGGSLQKYINHTT
jgi:hypothetical protein